MVVLVRNHRIVSIQVPRTTVALKYPRASSLPNLTPSRVVALSLLPTHKLVSIPLPSPALEPHLHLLLMTITQHPFHPKISFPKRRRLEATFLPCWSGACQHLSPVAVLNTPCQQRVVQLHPLPETLPSSPLLLPRPHVQRRGLPLALMDRDSSTKETSLHKTISPCTHPIPFPCPECGMGECLITWHLLLT